MLLTAVFFMKKGSKLLLKSVNPPLTYSYSPRTATGKWYFFFILFFSFWFFHLYTCIGVVKFKCSVLYPITFLNLSYLLCRVFFLLCFGSFNTVSGTKSNRFLSFFSKLCVFGFFSLSRTENSFLVRNWKTITFFLLTFVKYRMQIIDMKDSKLWFFKILYFNSKK